MSYSDYDFYHDVFCGTRIPSEREYSAAAVKARCYLDWLTNGRLRKGEAPEEAKLAECAVSELYWEKESSAGVHSEGNDGYQVVYCEPEETEMYRTALLYLPAALVYRGIGL